MFDFKNANEGQRAAIESVDGPVLITAGPGTGKTYTLIQRAIYMIQERGARPEELLMVTFTEKAAKELVTRITNELDERNIAANLDEMYVGTFHSICLRIISENLEYTRLKKNYTMLDAFDQQYLIYRNMIGFEEIEGFDAFVKSYAVKTNWQISGKICADVNTLAEEMVDADELCSDRDEEVATLGRIYRKYLDLLEGGNFLDFSSMQTECYRLLKENPDVLEKLQSKIKYIMVDEYQDTNYIQEQLVFMLGGRHNNICVVGDDDQGLYRFRGATIRNILEFPGKFEEGVCKIIPLVVNYRSDSDIVDFYNEWMTELDWENFRYDKKIEPCKDSEIKSPCVVKLAGDSGHDIYDDSFWYEKILDFIRRLEDSGKITDYNQIAFLFSSVKSGSVCGLASFLEQNGIGVYSPRSARFFYRNEIKLALGCLILMFPKYEEYLKGFRSMNLGMALKQYYRSCVSEVKEILENPENQDLLRFIEEKKEEHGKLEGTTDYAYSELLYKLFRYKPFSDILDTDLNQNVSVLRPVRNLALLTQIIGKYEYLYKINVFSSKYIEKDTDRLFNYYLSVLFRDGICEYEDDAEYAPSGHVSFMTIHQSKGMEFPIVFVDSLWNKPRGNEVHPAMKYVEENYYHRQAFEPDERKAVFDFWRKYYTAFSRAQDLLILTCKENDSTPSEEFSDIYEKLQSVDSKKFDLSEFDFHSVKSVNIKDKFSFGSHIAMYENCPRQYKFYRELEFKQVSENAMVFGMLVRETLDDIHKAVIRNEEQLITKENIESWFNTNYKSLSRSKNAYIGEKQLHAALNEILEYADSQSKNWKQVQQSEVDVSLVRQDYIIGGKLDLVRSDDGTIEIVNFKSEKKPDAERDSESLKRHYQQLSIYAYLIEQRTGQKISKVKLYYMGEKHGNQVITFPYSSAEIEKNVASFDDTVHKIQKKEFRGGCSNPDICRECDFMYYCRKKM